MNVKLYICRHCNKIVTNFDHNCTVKKPKWNNKIGRNPPYQRRLYGKIM